MSTISFPIGKKENNILIGRRIAESEILAESNLTTDHTNIIGNILRHGKTIWQRRRQKLLIKKRIKDEIQFIPSRIDRGRKMKPIQLIRLILQDRLMT